LEGAHPKGEVGCNLHLALKFPSPPMVDKLRDEYILSSLGGGAL